ncbi:MAG: VWA domain-containing protein [Planctomycetota bacterium]|nr:MAG: VWA domain-containing protein [Planctomycetota bacterium]
MNLSVVHLGLIAGVALAAIPVILHMVMRQKPKLIIFPALRLLKARQKQTTRRLRIRHWALLLSRMAVIALMSLCLARPTCNTTAPLGESNVPTAMAIVVDTSLSMQWTDARNRNRLTEAKAIAGKLVKETPITSQVFLIDSAEPIETPPMSPALAEGRIKSLELKAANRPLNSAIEAAYKSVMKSDRPRREVFVLTDLTANSLEPDKVISRPQNADADKEKANPVQLYLLRLNPPEPLNVGLRNLSFDAGSAVMGETLDIKIEITNQGPATTRILELWLDGRKREQKAVELSANADMELIFRTPPLDKGRDGLHQGEIRIRDDDPMPFDNTANFTVIVRPPIRVLVVTDLEQDAMFLSEALDPVKGDNAGQGGVSQPFRVEVLRAGQLEERLRREKDRPQAVIINNASQIPDSIWTQLNLAVRSGLGVAVALGDRSKPDSYSGPLAKQLLPAEPIGRVDIKPGEPIGLSKPDLTHPIFSQYAEELRTELTTVPVFRYQKVAKTEGVRELLQFSDGQPALLERVLDAAIPGRVLMWTMPLSRRPFTNDNAAWNDFPRSWSFVQVINRMVAYLADTSNDITIVDAGQDLTLPFDNSKGFNAALVKGPGDRPGDRRPIEPKESRLVITNTDLIGHWGVAFSGPGDVARSTGFSVNPPGPESQLRILTEEQLNTVFGKDGYALAQDPDSLEKAVGLARVGVEFFPWLMLLLLIVLAFENYLANKFYGQQGDAGPVVAKPLGLGA